MNVLGIIPARGGSVGIPRKNLAVVAGKSLLQWAIESARGTKLTSLAVSTNDDEIANAAMLAGVAVYRRPDELSQGEAVPCSSSTFRAMRYHVERMEHKPDAVMILQPTCPLRRPEDIDAAILRMEETGCDMVVSYSLLPGAYSERMAYVDERNHAAHSAFTAEKFAPRQGLKQLHVRSGDVYLITTECLLAGLEGADNTDTRAIIIPPEWHLNIDTPADLERAERILAGDKCTSRAPIVLRTIANEIESGTAIDLEWDLEADLIHPASLLGEVLLGQDLDTGWRTLNVKYRKAKA